MNGDVVVVECDPGTWAVSPAFTAGPWEAFLAQPPGKPNERYVQLSYGHVAEGELIGRFAWECGPGELDAAIAVLTAARAHLTPSVGSEPSA